MAKKRNSSMPVQAQTGYGTEKDFYKKQLDAVNKAKLQKSFDIATRRASMGSVTTPTLPTYKKPLQFQTRQEYDQSLLGQTVPIALANVIEGAASGATFGASDKLLGRGAGQMIPSNQQNIGEKIATTAGQVAGGFVPGMGMYSAASKMLPKAATVGKNVMREAGLGALTGAGYQGVTEALDAAQGGTQSTDDRMKDIALATAFGGLFGGGFAAAPAIGRAVREVATTPSSTMSFGGAGTGQQLYDAFVRQLAQAADTGASGGGGRARKPTEPTTPQEPTQYIVMPRNPGEAPTVRTEGYATVPKEVLQRPYERMPLNPLFPSSATPEQVLEGLLQTRFDTPEELLEFIRTQNFTEDITQDLYNRSLGSVVVPEPPTNNLLNEIILPPNKPARMYTLPRLAGVPRSLLPPKQPIQPGKLDLVAPRMMMEKSYPEFLPSAGNPNAQIYTKPQTTPTEELPYTVVNRDEVSNITPEMAKRDLEEQIRQSFINSRTPYTNPMLKYAAAVGIPVGGVAGGLVGANRLQENQITQQYIDEVVNNPQDYPQFFNLDGTVNEELLRQALKELGAY